VRYACCDERRLQAVKEAGALNGIEYVEVSHSEAPPGLEQRTLFVRLLLGPAGLSTDNVVIEGGERIPVAVEWAQPAVPLPSGELPQLTAELDDPDNVLLVRTDTRGDFSTYTLKLVAGATSDEPPADFDPLLAAVEFSFKVECPSDFDCLPACDCPPQVREVPAIDYLAKDFQSFRSLMLDRLSLLAPGWTERSTPDVGIAMVELLAYVADEISYRQDAVATEAYLQTARRRTSLRRHARLVDYVVHEGANARAWVRVFVEGEGVALARGTPLLTRVPNVPDVIEPDGKDHLDALAAGAETFETLQDHVLFLSHERFAFWTWGDAGCCLPRGATSATLAGDHPELKAGEVLVLTEVADPLTGKEADADPAKRAAVRLSHVYASTDPSAELFDDPPPNGTVTEIEWDEADALPFPLCISVEERPGLVVSEAWGNVVLADHGRTITGEPLGAVPDPVLSRVPHDGCDPCIRKKPEPVPIRFRPTLSRGPVTQGRAAPLRAVADGPPDAALLGALASLSFDPVVHDWLDDRGVRFEAAGAVVRGGHDVWSVSDGTTVALLRLQAGTLTVYARPAAAAATLASDARAARPAVILDAELHGAHEPWTPQLDLLGSDGDAPGFVVEAEHDGTATLRFGDGVHGRRPETGTAFEATYRVGNGVAGNIGLDAIAHIAKSGGGVTRVENPLPAAGGVDPETPDAIRRDAPEAYLSPIQRAVTEDDYAEVGERDPGVQRARATFRWTGSWHTVFVTADAIGGRAVDVAFENDLRRHLEPFRMAGHDLEVDAPRFVPLEVALHLCVEPDYFRAHVKAAVLDVLSSLVRTDGTLGFFHPDRFSFGQAVYLSAIIAAAQAVPGVESVVPNTFQRQHDDASSAIDTGVLMMNRLEVARLDNNPTFPDRGVLLVTAGGGK